MTAVRPKRAMIGLPSYKTVPSVAVGNLLRTTIENAGQGLLTALSIQTDMYIVMARNAIVHAALDAYRAGDITHLWWIDDDMIIPTGTLERLFNANKSIVGAVYYANHLKPVAYDIEPDFQWLEEVPEHGVHRVGGLGMGCTLVDCKVLLAMQEHFGDSCWFATSTHLQPNKTPIFYGEDVWFFKRAAEVGFKAYLDCDTICGHVHYAIIDDGAFKVKRRLQQEQGLGPDQAPVIK